MRIVIGKGEAGLFHATSPDMRSLFVSGTSEDEVLKAAPIIADAIRQVERESRRV